MVESTVFHDSSFVGLVMSGQACRGVRHWADPFMRPIRTEKGHLCYKTITLPFLFFLELLSQAIFGSIGSNLRHAFVLTAAISLSFPFLEAFRHRR